MENKGDSRFLGWEVNVTCAVALKNTAGYTDVLISGIATNGLVIFDYSDFVGTADLRHNEVFGLLRFYDSGDIAVERTDWMTETETCVQVYNIIV